ncbi:MAG: DUF4231 domain-containing protein [Bacillota bacterium]|nr:DUF4231 domain-containing protein [Bacillota bacterium]
MARNNKLNTSSKDSGVEVEDALVKILIHCPEFKYLEIDQYFKIRLARQLLFFEDKARISKKNYTFMKRIRIWASIITSLSLSVAFAFQDLFVYFGLGALVASTAVLFCYQWEEFHNNGTSWTNYRLVSNKLQTELNLFISKAGKYKYQSPEINRLVFMENVEMLIENTDITFSSLNSEVNSTGKLSRGAKSDNLLM